MRTPVTAWHDVDFLIGGELLHISLTGSPYGVRVDGQLILCNRASQSIEARGTRYIIDPMMMELRRT